MGTLPATPAHACRTRFVSVFPSDITSALSRIMAQAGFCSLRMRVYNFWYHPQRTGTKDDEKSPLLLPKKGAYLTEGAILNPSCFHERRTANSSDVRLLSVTLKSCRRRRRRWWSHRLSPWHPCRAAATDSSSGIDPLPYYPT